MYKFNSRGETLVAEIVKRGLDLTLLSKAIGWHATVWRIWFPEPGEGFAKTRQAWAECGRAARSAIRVYAQAWETCRRPKKSRRFLRTKFAALYGIIHNWVAGIARLSRFPGGYFHTSMGMPAFQSADPGGLFRDEVFRQEQCRRRQLFFRRPVQGLNRKSALSHIRRPCL